MTAIPAPGRQYDRTLDTGIRPFDISRDLRAVAELISVAFASELDDRGASALREMRFMSHFGGFLGAINRSTSDLGDMLNGFVWVESGRVVGNVTVQRADKFGTRWQIANVAVAPEYRGRGISRRLMESALDHVASCGGQWAVLQVYSRNLVARHLYESMAFEEVGGTVELRAEQVPDLQPVEQYPYLTAFEVDDWQPLFELANYQLGPLTQWWRPIRRTDFQESFESQLGEWFGRLLGREQVYRRAVQVSPRFEAAVVLTARRRSGEHDLRIWVRPEHYGVHDATLIRWAMDTLQGYPRLPVHVSLSTDHSAGQDLLAAYSFRPLRTLLTMRRSMAGGA